VSEVKLPRLPGALGQDGETVLRAVRMPVAAAPRLTAVMGGVTLVEALLPAATVWLLKRIIDTVASTNRASVAPANAGETALFLAGCYLVVLCLQQILSALSRLLQAQIYDVLSEKTNLQVLEKVASYPDLSPFESPAFQDRLQLLKRDSGSQPMHLLTSLTQILRSGVTLLSMLLFLAGYHPGLFVILAITAAPSLLFQRRLAGRAWFRLVEMSPMRRRLGTLASVLVSSRYAKEVRLFGFARYFLDRYQALYLEMLAFVQRTRRRLIAASLGLSLLAALGVGAGFFYVIGQALKGALTIGDLSLYTAALFQANGAAASLTGALGRIHESLPFLRELFAFLDSAPSMRSPEHAPQLTPAARADHGRSRQGFRLERVAFSYPDTERQVFEALDLEIPWGRTTAIVGENGAGKSTIVKLLARLHDPTAGRILLDGIDLRDYDLEHLRRQIAAVFQEFGRYPLTVRENIALGEISRLEDRARIREAARHAGADAVIRRLPGGEETLLARGFEGAEELSGGEWQKIALARAFMRDAPILILDEPTAALDVRSEYEIYQRFVTMAEGRTTLLISHRFSTVRMADRILVLDDGRVIEEGDHHSLVAGGGRYAELYAMQAERYRQ
jgi:ATP-binding cassette subfamily B protein